MKATFSIQDKKIFCKECKVFTPVGIATVMASWISFFFSPHWSSCWTNLSWNGEPQWQTSIYSTYQAIQLFLMMSWLFSASWEHFQHPQWHFAWVPWCYSRLMVLQKIQWKIHENQKRSFFYHDPQFIGETSHSCRDD